MLVTTVDVKLDWDNIIRDGEIHLGCGPCYKDKDYFISFCGLWREKRGTGFPPKGMKVCGVCEMGANELYKCSPDCKR